MRLLLLLAVALPACLGYPYFQKKLPNGDRIPHPCKPNYIWHGVGHKNEKGGGARNVFGEDFEKNGFVWDKCLCERDSDGDGKTNGEELGDPKCVWTPGSKPEVVAASELSHPGVCEPYGSEQCKGVNTWEFCNVEEFKCPAFEAEGVKNVTVKFPRTSVPSAPTTYMCMMFELDVELEGDLHIIGSLAQIDNANVMHHMVVAACDNIDTDSETFKKYQTPQPCGMTSATCTNSLGGWTVGMEGDCFPDSYGLIIGDKNKKAVINVEFHWNNPEERSDYTDASGITYFYEPRRRQHDATGGAFGVMPLEIPPRQAEWSQSHVCSAACTRDLAAPLYISRMLPHMHYLGRRFIMEHWRNGTKLATIVEQNDYRYDTPVTEEYDPPIEVLPGDEFLTTCVFSSATDDQWTYYGEGTYDEMCFGLMTYYPVTEPPFVCIGHGSAEAAAFCTAAPNSTVPTSSTRLNDTAASAGGCADADREAYWETTFGSHYEMLYSKCDPQGLTCKDGCKEMRDQVLSHPCTQSLGFLHDLGFDAEWGVPFRTMLNSCRQVPKDNSAPGGGGKKPDNKLGTLCPVESGEGARVAAINVAVIGVAFALVVFL